MDSGFCDLVQGMLQNKVEFMESRGLYTDSNIELFRNFETDRLENFLVCVSSCLDAIAQSKNNDELYEALSDFSYAANRLSDKLTELSEFCTYYSLHHREKQA